MIRNKGFSANNPSSWLSWLYVNPGPKSWSQTLKIGTESVGLIYTMKWLKTIRPNPKVVSSSRKQPKLFFTASVLTCDSHRGQFLDTLIFLAVFQTWSPAISLTAHPLSPAFRGANTFFLLLSCHVHPYGYAACIAEGHSINAPNLVLIMHQSRFVRIQMQNPIEHSLLLPGISCWLMFWQSCSPAYQWPRRAPNTSHLITTHPTLEIELFADHTPGLAFLPNTTNGSSKLENTHGGTGEYIKGRDFETLIMQW